MEVDRTYTQETTKHYHPSSHHMEPPQGRDEEVGHETPGKETRKKKRRRWDTPGEKWRRWPRTENGGVPWSMAYAPSEQTGISK